jgi:aminomethyltransferase
MSDPNPPQALQRTALHALHVELGAKMVPFAGYEMPLSYPAGIVAEHRHCRASAALFDVSHMGQLRLVGADAAAALETLVPVDVVGLAEGKQRYALFTNDAGGILDDLMVTRRADHLFLVVNAGCKDADLAHLRATIARRCAIEPMPENALLALQGPAAAAVVARVAPTLAGLTFLRGAAATLAGIDCFATRSGYTGEDGYEVLVRAEQATALAEKLLAHPEVKPIGLGARDSLRLEAGLCLYGHDLDPTTSPIEADLGWTIQKRRREAKDFPGAQRILREQELGVSRKRVGIRPNDRAPAREGVEIMKDGKKIGVITSGGFSPILNGPISMGYVDAEHAEPGHVIDLMVRGVPRSATITPLPFVPHRYHRPKKGI